MTNELHKLFQLQTVITELSKQFFTSDSCSHQPMPFLQTTDSISLCVDYLLAKHFYN